MRNSAARGARALLRTLRLASHLGFGMGLVAAMKVDRGRWLVPETLTAWWNAGLLAVLDLQVDARGQAQHGALIVSNHVSWLDIPVIVAHAETRFVSKSEVARWPVAGWLANAAGTFYIERGRHAMRPLLDRLVPFLRDGGTVTIFPEGTTTDGASVGHFHARMFAAAIEAGVPVQPVALRFAPNADGQDLAPFVGDDDLASHILRLLRSRGGISVSLQWLDPIPSFGQDRDTLAFLAQQAIAKALDLDGSAIVARRLAA